MKITWKANWIWMPDVKDVPNFYLFARRAFELPGKPDGGYAIHITAAHHYYLYVNGKLVGNGPDRCYFQEQYFDTYDVSGLLKKGFNVMAIRCHYAGRSLPRCAERLADGPCGLLVQMDNGARPFLWTDAKWKVIRDPAFAATTERISNHRAWREEFFAGKELPNWRKLKFDDQSWPNAAVIASATGGPWTKLIAKTTAPMMSATLPPVNMFLTNRGGGLRLGCNSYRFYGLIDKKYLREPGGYFTISNEENETQELLFDMGQVVAGYPRIDFADSVGGTIDVYYGDSLTMFHQDTIHLGKGSLVWSPFGLRGGRYFRLNIRGAYHPISIRSVRWVWTHYPVELRGEFQSSDSRLDRIWEICRLSAKTNALDHFVDCVDREQALWMMDFRFQALQHYYYFGDTALARKCFSQYAALQFENGHVLAYGPSCRPKEELAAAFSGDSGPYDWFGFNFYLILAVWEYYQFTGDRRFLEEFHSVCARCMAYYRKHEKEGFCDFNRDARGSPFVDWAYEGHGEGLYGFSQALYYGALMAQANIARTLSLDGEAKAITERATHLEKRFFERFIDPGTGRVADRLHNGERIIKPTIQPHAAVLRFFDHIPPKVRATCLDLILRRQVASSKTGFFNAFVVEALFRHGHPDDGLKLLSDYWGAIVDAGLRQTPEAFDMDEAKGASPRWSLLYSFCHSYASGAGVILQQRVLGATVEGRRVTITPHPGWLQHAKGAVPTIAGDVYIDWRRRKDGIVLKVRAPKAVDIQTVAPSDDLKMRSSIVRT